MEFEYGELKKRCKEIDVGDGSFVLRTLSLFQDVWQN
jgi:hypothetical protein